MTNRWHLNHAIHGNKPWAVQIEAMRRAAGRARYGQFLEQGLGKTPLTLNDYVEFQDCDLCVVLAPSSFVADWPLAPAEWGLDFLRTGTWHHDDMPFNWDSGLFSISHETLRNSQRARDDLAKLVRDRSCFFVFDEATGIKNPQSKLAKYIIDGPAKYAKRTRLLDGTPQVQNVMDWYAKLKALGEINRFTRVGFRNRFAKMGGFMGRQIVGSSNDEELARIIDGCAFRALKADWRKDLPPQIEVPVHLEMTDNQRKHYQTMMEELYAIVGDREPEEITVDMVLTQRIKLQQIASCMLMKDDRAFWLEEPGSNPKLKASLDVMNTGHGKTIVSYFFDASGRMLIDQYKKAGLNPAWITGGMRAEDIVAQKARFNNDSSCRVIVGQIDQTSRGHTLLGQKGKDRCYRLFMYETSLSLMHVKQLYDRNHRGEQDEPCSIFWPFCSPIDQLNFEILTGKRQRADAMDALIRAVRSGRVSA